MTEELIKLFECENRFEVRKELNRITDSLRLELLVELNRIYYFEYLLKKLSEKVGSKPTSSEIKKIKEIKESEFYEPLAEFFLMNIYSLKNNLLEYSEGILKVENIYPEAYWFLNDESFVFEEILLEKLDEFLKKQNKQIENEAIDLSDTSSTEKIIYLQKLGIIDFLRTQQPFVSVPDKVSQVISAITGINIDSVRPMVRPIVNNDFANRRNPLNSRKPTDKVTKQLIHIGFNETN
jgi:hypothetical protein